MREAVIVEALRTPVGKKAGAYENMRSDELLAVVLRELVERTGIDPAIIGDVICGCVTQTSDDGRIDFPAKVISEDGSSKEGRVMALGPEGVNVKMDDPPAISDEITLSIQLPHYPTPLEVSGTVKYHGSYGEAGFGLGDLSITLWDQSVVVDLIKRLIGDHDAHRLFPKDIESKRDKRL